MPWAGHRLTSIQGGIPPGPGGADGEPMTRTYNGYRMKCGDVDAEPTATNGRRMATSDRPVLCGTELNRILGKA